VLFCDVVGFTPLSEARDPEAVRELLSRYFDVARTIIGRYGGVVEKFIGDAVMAVWGTPSATEGDAERAVRAALDLVSAVSDLGAEAETPEVAARAGVVTGEVAVSLGAIGEGMVAGDAVNTAARVQAAGDIGELAVPDSLHALLAARLDALDPQVRRLVADAAVLGSTFPAEALVAVSGQDEASVRSALNDLVRREVLSVSADPLSPERGSYQFAQNMLRQVAYDTLSRRDRKTRHLTVAAHLRAVFAGDGEEVADVIARHYLDALHAVPDDGDAAGIRDQAISALIRGAERAERIGAPARAAASYAAAAELTPPDAAAEAAASLWEHAAEAADINADWPRALELVGRASECYLRAGQARAAARARAIAGDALRRWGRIAEAREQLTAALEVLRADPDTDTVRALAHLAIVETFASSADADRLSAEALTLGQALGVTDHELSELFGTRGMYLVRTNRRPEAASYYRESARLAEQAGDSMRLGRALLNLADALLPTDPATAAENARTAAGQLRRVGDRGGLAVTLINLAEALLMLGDWDTVEAELTRPADSDALADNEVLVSERCLLAALRGDTAAAETMLATLTDLRASEDPQDKAVISGIEGFIAAARRQPHAALRHAQATLAHADALGISHECLRWAWPLAARAAHDLRDTATIGELLVLLDSSPPGYLAPMLQAERDLTRARFAANDGVADGHGDGDGHSEAASIGAFTAALDRLREQSTPYHLAHGLLDYAAHLTRLDDTEAAAAAIEEARDIACRLRCQPLLERATHITPAELRVTP
jgi:tetratricopeptide (TPR) repeat protein